jgi:hypothetical protein
MECLDFGGVLRDLNTPIIGPLLHCIVETLINGKASVRWSTLLTTGGHFCQERDLNFILCKSCSEASLNFISKFR